MVAVQVQKQAARGEAGLLVDSGALLHSVLVACNPFQYGAEKHPDCGSCCDWSANLVRRGVGYASSAVTSSTASWWNSFCHGDTDPVHDESVPWSSTPNDNDDITMTPPVPRSSSPPDWSSVAGSNAFFSSRNESGSMMAAEKLLQHLGPASPMKEGIVRFLRFTVSNRRALADRQQQVSNASGNHSPAPSPSLTSATTKPVQPLRQPV